MAISDRDILYSLRDIIDEEYRKDLDVKPTFDKDMVRHIQNVYGDLIKQRQEWLSDQKNEEQS